MTLPASAPISMQQILTEFGAPAGTLLTAMVRGGAYVPNTAANAGIPTAPPIGLLDFLGGSAQVVSITDRNILVTGLLSSGSALAGYRLNTSGIVEKRDKATYSTLETWLLAGAAADYDARATITSQTGGANAGTFGSWLNLGTSREWSVNRAIGSAGISNITMTVEIRKTSTGVVLDTATIYLESER